MADDEAAKREEARLLKTMARRGPVQAKVGVKASASTVTPNVPAMGASSGVQSRTGAPLVRSHTSGPSTTSPAPSDANSGTSGAPTTPGTSSNANLLTVNAGGNAGSGSAPIQKSPSFGASRNIVPRTNSSTGPTGSSSAQLKAPTVDEEAIRRREEAFEAERARLRQIEQELIKNGKNALGDMAEINSEVERMERMRQEREPPKPTVSSAPKPAPPKTTTVNPPIKSPQPAATTSNDLLVSNKALIDDVDALLAELNFAAGQSFPSSSSSATAASGASNGPPLNPNYERAKDTLRARKASIPTFLSNARGVEVPEDIESELSKYIRDIMAAIHPIQELLAPIPLSESKFDYNAFATAMESLLLSIVRDIRLLSDHLAREMVSNYCMDLIDKALTMLQDIHEQSPTSSSSSTTTKNTQSNQQGESPDDIILASQNKFILFLKHLMHTISSATKKQVEEMQAKRDKNTALATHVQETALHAQGLARILKEPLFEPQAFKDQLSSLVTTIKQVSQLLPPGPKLDLIMDSTRRVLECSLRLQEYHQNPSNAAAAAAHNSDPATPSPHVQLFQAIGDLLRAILATIQK